MVEEETIALAISTNSQARILTNSQEACRYARSRLQTRSPKHKFSFPLPECYEAHLRGSYHQGLAEGNNLGEYRSTCMRWPVNPFTG